MTTVRIQTGLWARALLRRLSSQGFSAMVLARGDEERGAVLVVARTRAGTLRVLREGDMSDGPNWLGETMADESALDAYLTRQRRYDPDLWVLELEVETLDDDFAWIGARSGSAP